MDSLENVSSILMVKKAQIDITANNVANINTAAFKRSRSGFQDLLYQSVRRLASTDPLPPDGTDVLQVTAERVMTQGRLEKTENPLDLAINGSGFFQVELPTGEIAYTRDGHFTADGDGNLLTSNGLKLVPNVVLPPTARGITVRGDGTILAQTADDEPSAAIGNIELARFTNEEGLYSIGDNLFSPSDNSGLAVTGAAGTEGMGELRQNMLEVSNVDLGNEFTQLLMAQRSFQTGTKLFQTVDEMLRLANSMSA